MWAKLPHQPWLKRLTRPLQNPFKFRWSSPWEEGRRCDIRTRRVTTTTEQKFRPRGVGQSSMPAPNESSSFSRQPQEQTATTNVVSRLTKVTNHIK